jgi:hypothetical protein
LRLAVVEATDTDWDENAPISRCRDDTLIQAYEEIADAERLPIDNQILDPANGSIPESGGCPDLPAADIGVTLGDDVIVEQPQLGERCGGVRRIRSSAAAVESSLGCSGRN